MGIDNLEPLAIGENASFSEVASYSPTLPNQLRQKVEPLTYGTLSAGKRGNAKTGREAGSNGSERLSDLHGSLQALTELHGTHRSMESLLRTASRLVVNILDLEHCSIGWLEENALGIRVWASHTREGANINTDRVCRAFSGLVNRQRPQCSNSATPPSRLGPDPGVWRGGEIMSPLRVDKQIVGYVCGLKNESSNARILDAERSLFATLSQHISAAIEAQRTREMLDCPYIALALSPKERESFAGLTPVERPFLDPINNPERLVRKIARRFFMDLRRAGFETKQIMCVSTEILDSLLVVLNKTKSRRQKSPASILPVEQG